MFETVMNIAAYIALIAIVGVILTLLFGGDGEF
jgi:hypothetical protein